jgi:hypothetical protein
MHSERLNGEGSMGGRKELHRRELAHGLWAALAVRRALFVALSLVVLQVALAGSAQADPMPIGVPGSWGVRLNEEFSPAGLNTSLWTPYWYQGAMSGQCTAPNLVSQPGNGYLYLQVRAQASECSGIHNSNTGALIESDPGDGVPGHTGFKYSYGYVEWRAWVPGVAPAGWTCPKGGCMADWPALWSFPENQETEIDTMEGLKEVQVGGAKVGQTCYHFWRHSPIPETVWGGCPAGSFAGAWHTYGVDWEPGVLRYYYDGALVAEHPSGEITSTPQYLIMDDVPEGSHGGPLVVPNEMVVDYARVWQHPVAPTASTSGATEVGLTSAKLNGSVNPNGWDTHYYYEYGPTTAYGSSMPAAPGMDIGSGSSPTSTWNTVSALLPATTYHYRVVASNAGGTVYGTDQTFTTLGGTSPSVAIAETTGYQVIDYVNGSGGISYWSYTPGTGWSNVTLGGNAAPGTSPSVALDPTSGYQVVYYVNSSGGISYWNFVAGSGWSNVTLGGHVAPGTSPSSYIDPNTGYQVAYYQDSGGGISYWTYQPSTGWTNGTLGGHAAPGSSPDVAVVPSTGYQAIYYQDSSGGISQWSWASGSGWTNASLGGHAAPYTSPSTALAPSTGYQVAYYQDSGGGISYWSWAPGSGWTNGTLGGHAAPGSSPDVALIQNTGYQVIYYQNSSGGISDWSWASGSGWSNITLGGHVAPYSSPTIAVAPNTGYQVAYYHDSNGAISHWSWAPTTGWTNGSP